MNCVTVCVCVYMRETFRGKFLDNSVVLHLGEGRPVVVGIAHHDSELYRLGDLSSVGPFCYDADVKLKKTDRRTVDLLPEAMLTSRTDSNLNQSPD